MDEAKGKTKAADWKRLPQRVKRKSPKRGSKR
jgi:hypothetical protein